MPATRCLPRLFITLFIVLGPARPGHAADRGATCAVPSAVHSSIQEAVSDSGCGSISLSAGFYDESVLIERSLFLDGPAGAVAKIRGSVVVAGAATVATLADLAIESGCPETLISTGAEVITDKVEVRSSATASCPSSPWLIFASSFEIGDTSEWSSQLP